MSACPAVEGEPVQDGGGSTRPQGPGGERRVHTPSPTPSGRASANTLARCRPRPGRAGPRSGLKRAGVGDRPAGAEHDAAATWRRAGGSGLRPPALAGHERAERAASAAAVRRPMSPDRASRVLRSAGRASRQEEHRAACGRDRSPCVQREQSGSRTPRRMPAAAAPHSSALIAKDTPMAGGHELAKAPVRSPASRTQGPLSPRAGRAAAITVLPWSHPHAGRPRGPRRSPPCGVAGERPRQPGSRRSDPKPPVSRANSRPPPTTPSRRASGQPSSPVCGRSACSPPPRAADDAEPRQLGLRERPSWAAMTTGTYHAGRSSRSSSSGDHAGR